MTDINLTTGLPQLAENQFWRVKEREAGWWDSGLPKYVEVQLVERVEVDFREPRKFLGIRFGYKAWGRKITETILNYQPLWSDLKTPDNYTGQSVRHDGDSYFTVTPDEIEPYMILRAAQKVLDEYELKQKSRQLLGDYPPKSLNDPEEIGEN